MEASREIYWNVTRGDIAAMYLLAFASMGTCAWGFYRKIRVYLRGKPLNRSDALRRRILLFFKNALLQVKVMNVPAPGVSHAFLFWSFLLLFIGTSLIMLEVDFTKPLFNITFLRGTFYKAFSLTLDVAGFALILALAYFFIRRFFFRPEGLETAMDDYAAHGLLFAILVTGFAVEGARMAVAEIHSNPGLAGFSPFGKLIALELARFSPELPLKLHIFLWRLHMLLAMVFIALIPFTKLRHLFLTPVNSFFSDLRPRGSMETLNLEDEKAEAFGAREIKDFYWKDILDSDACMSCKRCQDRCPAYATDKPLSPMKVVQQIREAAFSNPKAGLIETVTPEVLWECTTCFACQEICPANIEHVNKILDMRRSMALMGGEFPGGEVKTAINNIEVNYNPFGAPFASRGDWAQGLAAPVTDAKDADILYFAGCYASFDKRNNEVAKSFLKICASAGVKVAIPGKDERCCGDPARKLGNEYLYQNLARENIKLFRDYGVSKIATTCPHCFNALNIHYRDLGLDPAIEVVHHASFVNSLIAEGRLKLAPRDFEFTYHDSCYLARYRDIIREPRSSLAKAGGKIVEMDKSGKEGFCCGGGGSRILAEEKIGRRINVERVKMAAQTGAPLVVSSCPWCLTMLEDGIKTADLEAGLKARDMAELVAQRLA